MAPDAAARRAADALTAAGFSVDYLEARDAITLLPLSGAGGETVRLLVAARIGATRLIDNMAV